MADEDCGAVLEGEGSGGGGGTLFRGGEGVLDGGDVQGGGLEAGVISDQQEPSAKGRGPGRFCGVSGLVGWVWDGAVGLRWRMAIRLSAQPDVGIVDF